MTPRHALTALARPHRYRVVCDAEGWPLIPGKLGRLGLVGATVPAAAQTD